MYPSTAELKPALFVVMPFGTKPDPSQTFLIDFDRVYEAAIKPAAEAAGVLPIRADEESGGGLVHVRLFERLLLAEIVVADVTIPSPNVFYELGVRHAGKPRSTILIAARLDPLPFDIAPMRTIFYDLQAGQLSDEATKQLIEVLIVRIRQAAEFVDSPLYELFPKLMPIELEHDVTESFQRRVKAISDFREEFAAAMNLRGQAERLQRLEALEQALQPISDRPSEIGLDLMLAYRSISAWDGMIRVAENFPKTLQQNPTVREQIALALNRRNAAGDRAKAIGILQQLIAARGKSAERCGLLGRIYKDIYKDKLSAGRTAEAEDALGDAIAAYADGFRVDPRDYYPGINAITLSLLEGSESSLERVGELLPVVAFALARRGGLESRDYWEVATVLELAAVSGDWRTAARALARARNISREAWQVETTRDNLALIRDGLQRAGKASSEVGALIRELDDRRMELTNLSSASTRQSKSN